MTQAASARPIFAADHVSWTVADADAVAQFYIDVLGATELFRMGPLDAADLPAMPDGRDWMAAHVNVPGACLRLIMLKLTDTLNFQLVEYAKPADRTATLPRNCDAGGHHLGLRVEDVQAAAAYLVAHGCTAMNPIEIHEGPLAGKTNLYLLDPWGHQLEIVD
ncbi:MAG TPA: VOC family protein [Novosphingobium sp.]|nr:VOC family protein [Novosphingobium sp.]